MSADHPGWAGESKTAFANKCKIQYKQFGQTLSEYPNYHYDEKSWRPDFQAGDRLDGYAERTLKAYCHAMNPEDRARGWQCYNYSVEARAADEYVKKKYIEKLKNAAAAAGKFTRDTLVDPVGPEVPLPPRFHSQP